MEIGISGKKIVLKVLGEQDLEKIFRWKNNVELSRFIQACPLPVAMYEMKEWFEKNQSDKNQVLWGIYEKKMGQCIGIVRLMFINWISRNAEFGIFIGDQKYIGKGIGKEALELAVHFAFNDLNLYRVYLKVTESNTAAIGLYESCGFKNEGILREHYWVNDGYEDVLVMGLLEDKHEA